MELPERDNIERKPFPWYLNKYSGLKSHNGAQELYYLSKPLLYADQINSPLNNNKTTLTGQRRERRETDN
jgi:hypothetical protein